MTTLDTRAAQIDPCQIEIETYLVGASLGAQSRSPLHLQIELRQRADTNSGVHLDWIFFEQTVTSG